MSTASLTAAALVRRRFPGPAAWRSRRPPSAGRVSSNSSKTTETCLSAPMTQDVTGMPWPSLAMRRLLPSLLRSVGLRPVCGPTGVGTPVPSMLNRLKSSSWALRSSLGSSGAVLPHTCCLPIAQAPPAGHVAFKARFLRQCLPWMLVCGTSRMPLRAISSLTRGCRLLSEGMNADSGQRPAARSSEQRRAYRFILASPDAAPIARHVLGDDRTVLAALSALQGGPPAPTPLRIRRQRRCSGQRFPTVARQSPLSIR